MEASTLTHAHRRGLFARPSPLLRLQGDEKLVALTRAGNQAAFETLVARYQSRLLGFCRQMLKSQEDAEDVLQEVFVAAYNAMIADERSIAVRPWLYRIARNRSLNHLRKPKAEGQDTMDTHAHLNGVTTHEHVQNREDFRNLLSDVGKLPETQRTALLLREIDAMSYDEIAHAMDTTIPGVKSLLVRARIALAESTESRRLSCDEVRLSLAEASEGLAKASGAVRRHVRSCENCRGFRDQLRSNSKVFAALFPVGPLVALKSLIAGKLGGGAGATATSGVGATATSGAGAASGSAGAGALGGATAVGGGAVSGGAGAVGAAVGSKAAAGLATAALLTAGAVEVAPLSGEGSEPATASPAAVERPFERPAPPQRVNAPIVPKPRSTAKPIVVTPTAAPVADGEAGTGADADEAAQGTATSSSGAEHAGTGSGHGSGSASGSNGSNSSGGAGAPGQTLPDGGADDPAACESEGGSEDTASPSDERAAAQGSESPDRGLTSFTPSNAGDSASGQRPGSCEPAPEQSTDAG